MALTLGLHAHEIRAGLKTFKGAYGRSELRVLPSGVRVLCDYYNANPTSIQAALRVLEAQTPDPATRRRVCLGDMLELGPDEERYHRELAPFVLDQANRPGDQILLYGPRMKWLEQELKSSPKLLAQVRHFETHAKLAEALKVELKPADFVLIKGSRSMKMEGVWALLSTP